MKHSISYRLLIVLLGLVAISGCTGGDKTMNRRVTFWRNDKIPYGTWYAYQELKHIFPQATITVNKRSPDHYKAFLTKEVSKTAEAEPDYENSKSAYIIISAQVVPDDNEVTALLSQVAEGQHVFISSMRFSETLLDSLRLKVAYYTSIYNVHDSLTVGVNNCETNDSLSYTYPGFALDNYITSMDSSITTILGKDAEGHANFVKFTYDGGGSLFIHLAPTALTNFFLLHKQNKTYYDNVLSYLPKNAEVVRWDDYFRYHERGEENNNFSALGWLLRQKPPNAPNAALPTAFWLLLALFLVIYLFESKRKQRIIPVISPLKNASLDFVKTIGRLYFQRRDNRNLAQKMTAHFLDHVRSKYSIRASITDPEFENRLAWKSGYDVNTLKDLLYNIRMVQDEPSVSDERLLDLNRRLEHFYKYA